MTPIGVVLFVIVMATSLFVTLRVLHQWLMRDALRLKLLDVGVPVCLKCGYGLRGLSTESATCPECGEQPGARARALLVSRVPPAD